MSERTLGPGHRFDLEVFLNGPQKGDFSWEFVNQLGGEGWQRSAEFPFFNDLLRYSVCLPQDTCWRLSLLDFGALGDDGYFKLSIANDEVFKAGKDDLQVDGNGDLRLEHFLCVGRDGECSDSTRDFKYRFKKRNGREKKRDMTCEELGDLSKKSRKKICELPRGRKGRARVKVECPETCGKRGLGSCQFLEEFDSDEIDYGSGLDYVEVFPMPDENAIVV